VPNSLAADRKLEKPFNSLRLAQYPVFCNKARTVLFWAVTQRVLAITYRRFDTTYRYSKRNDPEERTSQLVRFAPEV